MLFEYEGVIVFYWMVRAGVAWVVVSRSTGEVLEHCRGKQLYVSIGEHSEIYRDW